MIPVDRSIWIAHLLSGDSEALEKWLAILGIRNTDVKKFPKEVEAEH